MSSIDPGSGLGARGLPRLFRWVSGIAIVAVAASTLVGFELATAPAAPASAASAGAWDPGYIIDDSIFYDSNSMNASQVQAFLNARVPQCETAAYVCLPGYGAPTETRAPDRYCPNAYNGAPYQTAAQIIDGVARACGINQRVLLTLLEKEQGLVTSTWPSSRAYSAATGMSCPDTAGCDPQFAGFFYQVYFAARQFQVYRLNPTSFGYRAGRVNNIQYNPNADCGTQSVYISNQATASLYIYTPYVPNAAALGNLYGTGDGCSSYGNRNFWRIFSDWFGDPHQYTVADGFASYWNSQGGAAGIMGAPTSYLIILESNGGSYQRFQGGTAYASYSFGTAFVAKNVIGDKYTEAFGPTGQLGWPSSEQMCASNGVCFQNFAGGTITTKASVGTQVLWGGLGQYWSQAGGPYTLGAALAPSNYYPEPNGVGWVQRFEGGSIAQSVTGTFSVPRDSVERLWQSSGSGQGSYGWPTNAYSCVNSSCAQNFQGAVLSYTASNGPHAILWGFEAYWTANGGLSTLGAGLTDLRGSNAAGGGWVQQFGAAALTLRPNGVMSQVPYGPIWSTWVNSGAEAGTYGWPLASAECAGGACGQRFDTATITTSPQGTYSVVGGFTGAWSTFGGITTVGPASAALRYTTASDGGWSQQFSNGVITQMQSGTPLFTPISPILSVWQYYGAEGTWLGWPTSAQQCAGTACTQTFQHGIATSDGQAVSFTPS